MMNQNTNAARAPSVAKDIDDALDKWSDAYQRTWENGQFVDLFKNKVPIALGSANNHKRKSSSLFSKGRILAPLPII
jgi:hypothetical protein